MRVGGVSEWEREREGKGGGLGVEGEKRECEEVVGKCVGMSMQVVRCMVGRVLDSCKLV